jgi:hypothetical protein
MEFVNRERADFWTHRRRHQVRERGLRLGIGEKLWPYGRRAGSAGESQAGSNLV